MTNLNNWKNSIHHLLRLVLTNEEEVLIDDILSKIFRFVEKNYSPIRTYHNLNHIFDLLSLFDDHFLLFKKSINNESDTSKKELVIMLSILFHDIVYEPTSSTNEEDSVTILESVLLAYNFNDKELQQELLDEITKYILTTKTHHKKRFENTFSNQNEDVFLLFFIDLDLSILASSEDRFNRYSQQIRKEFEVYPENEYISGRSAFLENFLNQPYIYATKYFHNLWEEKARENISREILLLKDKDSLIFKL